MDILRFSNHLSFNNTNIISKTFEEIKYQLKEKKNFRNLIFFIYFRILYNLSFFLNNAF